MADTFIRSNFFNSGIGCRDFRGNFMRRAFAKIFPYRYFWRASAHHYYQITHIYCSDSLRRNLLHADEFFNDNRSSGDAHARSLTRQCQLRFAVTCECHERPEFFTGKLISRFGAIKINVLDLLLTAISTVIGLDGVDVLTFGGCLFY